MDDYCEILSRHSRNANIGMLVYKIWFPALMHGHHHYPTTYGFPIRYKLVYPWAGSFYSFNLSAWIEAAKELEAEGVAAITSCCGRVGVMQKELANAVNIPVFSSSVLQVPIISQGLKRGQKVGMVTSPSTYQFLDRILKSCDVDESVPLVVVGMKPSRAWTSQWGYGGPYDPRETEREVVDTTMKMISENPEVGAILLECTEMPLYTKAVRKATGLPVSDSTDLIRYVQQYYGKK